MKKSKSQGISQFDSEKSKGSEVIKIIKKNSVLSTDDLQVFYKQSKQIQIEKFEVLYNLFRRWR